MKSSLKQWRRLALGLMLAWVLLFLALFSYFMDSRVEEPRAASALLAHAESRRLASVSGSVRGAGGVGGGGSDGGHQHRAIMGSPRLDLHPRATASAARVPLASISTTTAGAGGVAASREQRAGASPEPGQQQPPPPPPSSREQPPLSRETAYYSPDPQSLAAWSAFGTQDVGSHSRSAPRSRENRLPEGDEDEEEWRRQQQQQQEEEEEEAGGEEVEEEEEEEVVVGGRRSRRTTTAAASPARAHAGRWEASDELEEYYFSKSKSVVQRLWQGRVSAGMLSPRLQKAMKDYLSANKHRVAYGGARQAQRSAHQLMCQLKRRVRVRTLDGTEAPFAGLGWRSLVPGRPLERLYGSGFGSCAVVTSAGAILHSGLGKEIDSHDAVLRFNAAPTEGYERDVGNKTTIRIINSQILANPKHQFNSSSLYKNVTLVAWDPAPYAVNLHKWYMSPDYNLFSPYVEHRKHFPAQPFYILHPRFIWQLWDVIQGNTLENIQPNPPSSGFIGILLMMALCEEVHVYEYIPSVRQTDLCHYHERYFDAACTLGAYHPLLYEKMLVQRINTGPERDLRTKGKVTLPGFSTVQCDP
ncbi:beta-galactoside alpha-2,6-sialyltransferase 2 [Sardina pilchardus]|uniref:beta-galactoside alpha-2,6-sialyltransferase 2 n=1 Tax=Sardina pilchardus TaxID=27697 RepID=UPI002E0E43DC